MILVATDWSDERHLEVFGSGFKVVSAFSEAKGWAVTTCMMGNESPTKYLVKTEPHSPFTALWLAGLIQD